MYAIVPTVLPGLVSNSSNVAVGIAERLIPSATVVSFARPNSRIFARPRFVTKMFAGLMSRWTSQSAAAGNLGVEPCRAAHGATAPAAPRLRRDDLRGADRGRAGDGICGGGCARGDARRPIAAAARQWAC